MAMNRIQFQQGLSMPEFLKDYGSEAQCEQALEAIRWPDGFRCPRCANEVHSVLRDGSRKVFQCSACRHQASLIAGTVFHGTKLPLTTWFLAIDLISQAKTGLSALALRRQLGVSYPTAWLIHHKLMQAMGDREEHYVLEGKVQVDDAYLGGERAGSINGGRKAANKTAFVAAVQTREDGRPLYVRMVPVADFTNQEMAKWAQRYLAAGAHVVSDGTNAFAQVRQVGATHERYITGGGRQGAQTPQLHWVNTVLGNLKTSMAGTYHSFDHAKYAARYLGEFCYRFNRRFDLAAMVPRLLRALVSTRPLPLKVLRVSEVCS